MTEQAPAPSPAEAVDDLAIAWDTGIASGDPEAMLALYVDEGAAAMPPDQPAVEGKEALRGFFEEMFAMGEVEVQDIPQDVVAGESHIAGKGTYVLTQTNAEGETMEDSGNWLSVSVWTEDGWKMVRNIWNRNRPLPGAPEPPPIPESGPEPAADAACYQSPMELDQGFEAELEAGNVAALVAAHTPDGSRIPPDMPEVKGPSQLAAYLASRMEPFSERVLDLTEIVEMVDQNLGITVGNFAFDYTYADGSGGVSNQGKYMAVSKKGDDGCWRLHWVLWNSNTPATG
jgi:ketosteroid isomerase-like protein